MDLDAVTDTNVATLIADAFIDSYDKDPIWFGDDEDGFFPFEVGDRSVTNTPAGAAQVTLSLTDGEGNTRKFTARITVQETR